MARAPGQNYGGYEYEFVDEAPEKLICNICTKVQRDPHLTSCCGQHFCGSCLENWFKRQQKSCPHCRERYFNHFLNKAIKREINELKIQCTHHGEGCQWIGQLGSLQTHLDSENGCDYMEVKCPNRPCSNHIKRKDLPEHLSSDCAQRSHRCEHCGYEDTYLKITTYHYELCPEYPVECPHMCGAEAIKRKDMSAHRDECPEELVECPNECIHSSRTYSKLKRKPFYEGSIKRKDLPDHLSNECYLRKYKCEHCDLEDTYENISGIRDGERRRPGRFHQEVSHYEICPEYPLECPNKCDIGAIKRKDMSTHRDKCPEEPMECPFEEAGCETKLVRRDFDDHVKTQMQQHLLLTFQKMTTLRKNYDTLRKRCDKLESMLCPQPLPTHSSFVVGPGKLRPGVSRVYY